MSNNDSVFQQFFERTNTIKPTGKNLGSGSFSSIKEVKMGNRLYAAKLIEINDSLNDYYKTQEPELILNLRNPHVARVAKIFEDTFNNKRYILIIMEKAELKDLSKVFEFFHHGNLLKLIYFPYFLKSSENLVRYITKQIVNSFILLDLNDVAHFDIKPSNLLMFSNIIVKLSDFSISKDLSIIQNIDKNYVIRNAPFEKMKIPGGTQGYLTLEYYNSEFIKIKYAKSQDYFALGCVIYFLLYGKTIFKFPNFFKKNTDLYCDRLTDLISKKIIEIKSDRLIDEKLKEFICNLIQYKPQNRPNLEEIYRNSWINDKIQNDMINKIWFNFYGDDEKILTELQKSDFVVESIKNNKKNIIINNTDKDINNNEVIINKHKRIKKKFNLKKKNKKYKLNKI